MPDGSIIQDRNPLTVPSTRRNPVLADVFNRLGYMERKGSGFGKIISGYEFQKNYDNSKKPSFISDRYQFTVVMPNLNYGIAEINDIGTISDDANRGANRGANRDANYEEIKDTLIANIRQNPNITQIELSSLLSLSKRTIQRIMRELVDENEIVRIGSTRSGYWKVVDENKG